MRCPKFTKLYYFILLIAVLCAPAWSQNQNRFIVHLSSGGNINQVVGKLGGSVLKTFNGSGSGVYVVGVPSNLSQLQAIAILKTQGSVLNVEPDVQTRVPEADPASQFQPAQVWNTSNLYSFLLGLQNALWTSLLNAGANTGTGMASAWPG